MDMKSIPSLADRLKPKIKAWVAYVIWGTPITPGVQEELQINWRLHDAGGGYMCGGPMEHPPAGGDCPISSHLSIVGEYQPWEAGRGAWVDGTILCTFGPLAGGVQFFCGCGGLLPAVRRPDLCGRFHGMAWHCAERIWGVRLRPPTPNLRPPPK